MLKYLKKDYIISNWTKIREVLFLLLLFSYIMLRLYNTSWVVLGDMIPGFDVFTAHLESYGFPALLIVLYLINLLIDKTYFNAKTEILKIAIFVLFAIVSTEHIICLVSGAFLLCADFSSVKKISAAAASSIILGTLCVIVASKTGWTGDYLVPRLGRDAHYFGFYHYAVWARQVLFASLFYIVAKVRKLTLAEIAVFAVIQAVVFYYSTQRLTFVVSILSVIVLIVFVKYEIIKINNKFIGSLSAIAFPAAMLGTIWISLIYDESNVILSKLSSILNNRIMLQRRAIDTFDVKLLFGQQVHHVTDFYLFIDNGYLYSLYAYGIVLALVIVAMLSFIFWKSSKTNNTTLFCLFAIILVYLLVDGFMTDMSFIGTALLFFPVLLKEHLTEKNIL